MGFELIYPGVLMPICSDKKKMTTRLGRHFLYEIDRALHKSPMKRCDFRPYSARVKRSTIAGYYQKIETCMLMLRTGKP